MKSVVVIVNGCIRDSIENYVMVIKNINTYLHMFDVSIYIHTWEPFPITNKSIHQYNYNKEEYIKLMKSLPNVNSIIFEQQKTDEELNILGIPYNKLTLSGGEKASKECRNSIFNCFTAFKSLLEKIKSTNTEYDYLLRVRNDLIININDFNPIIEHANNNELCIPPNYWCGEPYKNDHWVFGKYNILKYILTYNSIQEYIDKTRISWNQEELTHLFLLQNNNILYIFNNVSKYLILHGYRKFV
jgi:hypothetical protein